MSPNRTTKCIVYSIQVWYKRSFVCSWSSDNSNVKMTAVCCMSSIPVQLHANPGSKESLMQQSLSQLLNEYHNLPFMFNVFVKLITKKVICTTPVCYFPVNFISHNYAKTTLTQTWYVFCFSVTVFFQICVQPMTLNSNQIAWKQCIFYMKSHLNMMYHVVFSRTTKARECPYVILLPFRL